MKHRITIEEVARLAGVSTATVSRVLSRPDVVRTRTQEQVMAAVRQLDYQPDAAARALEFVGRGVEHLEALADELFTVGAEHGQQLPVAVDHLALARHKPLGAVVDDEYSFHLQHQPFD